MSLKAYMYKLDITVAVLAESEEEAQAKMDQGQASQISFEKNLISSTDIVVDQDIYGYSMQLL